MADYTTRLTLEEAAGHVGWGVIYHPGAPGGKPEPGYITSVNSVYVFVRFRGDDHSKACRPVDLTLTTQKPTTEETTTP